MEDRIMLAGALLLAMAMVVGFIVSRKLAERRRFKERQMGRGKDN